MVKTIPVLAGMLALVCSALALTLSPEDEAARQAALDWLRVVDAGKYEDAANAMSEEARGTKQWIDYFAKNRASSGRMEKRRFVEINHTPTVKGAPVWWKFATVRLQSSFERKPNAREEVALIKTSCCWEVSGYRIVEAAKSKD